MPKRGKVRLEPLTVAHAEELFPLLADPQVYQYIQDLPPASISALIERFRRLESRYSPDGSQRWLNWAIRRLSDSQCVGFVQATIYPDHTAEFAFVLGARFWGLGFARDASLFALHTLFTEFAVKSVFATADQRNVRSSGLLKRLGFLDIQPASYPHRKVLSSDHVFQLSRNA